MIDETQLHPVFRPTSLKAKREKERLRKWKGVFYTLRTLCWREACRNLRAEGLANGTLTYDPNGEVVTQDGQPLTVLFNEYRQDFDEGFDRCFAKATIEEMASYASDRFGMSLQDLLELNEQRLAEFRKREARPPIPSFEQPF
jgi:hypothetical protein